MSSSLVAGFERESPALLLELCTYLVALCETNKAVVFSEGRLYLDECDFSGSSAAVLVYAGQEKFTVIRNAVLGELNCE